MEALEELGGASEDDGNESGEREALLSVLEGPVPSGGKNDEMIEFAGCIDQWG